MELLQVYKGDFLLLIEAGFIAANQTDEDSAQKLFKAAHLLNRENQLYKLGIGYIHFLKLETSQSVKAFREVVEKEPDNEVARALLGLALSLGLKNVDEGEAILEGFRKDSKDETVKNMASHAVQFIEKFVKKDPTPVQIKTKKKNKGKVKNDHST